MSSPIQKIVRPNVRSLKAYEATEIPCRIKLDANESPYAPSASSLSRVLKNLEGIALNRYPDPGALELRSLLARRLKVSRNEILLGNGSDELISLLITTFGGPVLYPVPTFSMYGILSQGLGEQTVPVDLDSSFDIDLRAVLPSIRRENPKLIFLSSPNNPTGNQFSPDRIERILRVARGIVVIDEAYQPFSSGRSFVSKLKQHPNLVVLQTLSKIGLAGLRLGLMIASEEIAQEVNKVRLPFNVNALSQMAALASLSGRNAIDRSIQRVITERRRLFRNMGRIAGVQPFPTDANFILFRVNNPGRIQKQLLSGGVLVRNLHPMVPGCLRVTVGTRDENSEFLRLLEKSMA